MEPGNIKTKLFLANALLTQFFSEQGARNARYMLAAQEQYQQVLAQEPHHNQAMHGLMGIAINSRRPAEALELARKLMEWDASDPIAPYTAGVAQWMIVYPEYAKAKVATGGRVDEYFLHDANVRKSLREKYSASIEDGLAMSRRAVSLKPDFDEAMAYTNLLLRLKGGISDTMEESNLLIGDADAWVGKAISFKKGQGQQPAGNPTIDVDGPIPALPAPKPIRVAPPPPPPPPPPPRPTR
jgi:tetratricopeptide (TPR) repeat protein